jgi:hypothetical protein
VEWVGPSTRKYASLIIAFFGPVGELYFLFVSYFARDWFWIIIAMAVPFAIDALLWWYVVVSKALMRFNLGEQNVVVVVVVVFNEK